MGLPQWSRERIFNSRTCSRDATPASRLSGVEVWLLALRTTLSRGNSPAHSKRGHRGLGEGAPARVRSSNGCRIKVYPIVVPLRWDRWMFAILPCVRQSRKAHALTTTPSVASGASSARRALHARCPFPHDAGKRRIQLGGEGRRGVPYIRRRGRHHHRRAEACPRPHITVSQRYLRFERGRFPDSVRRDVSRLNQESDRVERQAWGLHCNQLHRPQACWISGSDLRRPRISPAFSLPSEHPSCYRALSLREVLIGSAVSSPVSWSESALNTRVILARSFHHEASSGEIPVDTVQQLELEGTL